MAHEEFVLSIVTPKGCRGSMSRDRWHWGRLNGQEVVRAGRNREKWIWLVDPILVIWHLISKILCRVVPSIWSSSRNKKSMNLGGREERRMDYLGRRAS